MHPFLLLLLQLLLAIVVLFSGVPISVSVDDGRYVNCSRSFQCANLENIGYPFWGSNRADYCGFPEFQLNCSGDAPVISIEDQQFRVISINQSQSSLTVARADYWKNVCRKSLTNTTTIDSLLLDLASDVKQLALFCACPPLNIPLPPELTSQFNCTINSANSINYFLTEDLNAVGISNISGWFGTCNTTVMVQVSESAASNLALNTSGANLATALDSGFNLVWDASNTLCQRCQGSGGKCGYNMTSAEFTCYCKNGPNPSNCAGATINWKLKVAIGVCSVVGTSLILVAAFCVIRGVSVYEEASSVDVETFIQNIGPLAVKRYKFSAIRKITDSFKDKLGQGGFGDVYKGKLQDGCSVAVKVLKESKGNGQDFVNEVASISRTSHVNVVTLLGYCFEGKKKALIYEFMPNGSLEKFIYKGMDPLKATPNLDLKTLFQVSIGIARGLEYLHRGCNTRILHFDIKPHNILLDENFCPKISDFGLSRLCTRKESIISMLDARGTIGYIAPEICCRNFGGVSAKSDVYSYGMMILEMVGGRKNIDARVSNTSEIYFPDWIYKNIEQDINFGLHNAVTDEEKEIARKMILVGLWCIQTRPADRPSMSRVIEMLEGSVEALQIPPKPVLSSPVRSLTIESTTSSTS